MSRDAEEFLPLSDAAVRAVAARDEASDWNPLAGVADTRRVFGALPGGYGAGVAAPVAQAILAGYFHKKIPQ